MRSAKKRRGARLGQHFLTGQWAARKLAEAVNVRPDETILEIGPGKGALTKELLATGARIVAVEKDEALVEQLKTTFANEIASGKLTLITGDIRDIAVSREPDKTALDARRGEGDARDVPKRTMSAALRLRNEADGVVLPDEYVVAANIPYYITGEIIRQFLTADTQPRAMALLVQTEVAERIVARDGKESILSLSVKAYGTPKIVAKVSKGNFTPAPSVDSAILLVENISRDFFKDCDEKKFFDVVHAGFASKRKQVSGNLKKRFGSLANQALTGLPEKVRAEDMSLVQWKKLAQQLP